MYTEQMSEALSIAAAPVPPASQSVGTADTGGVDMSLFRRVMFALNVGVFGASATVDMKLQESTDNSTFTDVAGSGAAITQLLAAGGSNKEATLEVKATQLTKRYCRARVTVGTAATFTCCIPFAGEAIHKPGKASDDASVKQRQYV